MHAARLLCGCAVFAALGCSGDAVPAPASLSGTWDFSYVTTSEAGATCHSTMTFTISQTDQTFVGTQRNAGTLFCEGVSVNLQNQNPTDPTAFTGELLTAGVVSPSEVAFRLNTLMSQDAGKVEENGLMTGRTTWVLPIKPKGTVTLNGTWTAFKQSQ
jgi:hypothetical protein